MAARQVLVGKGRYAGVCLVAALLVFFAGLMGRVDSWLGPNGEGLMDAFNPADLHIAAQPMGETSLSAMGLLMAFLYTMVAVFVLVATLLTAEKLLRSERRDLAIYRALGFPARRLQVSFALRFCLVGFAGSLLGTALSAVLTDPLVALLLRAEGISNFSSQPGWIVVALPGAVVTGLFSLFALLAAGKLKRIPLSTIASQ